MALPIKETPVLEGKDAERFLKKMKEVDENYTTVYAGRKLVKWFNVPDLPNKDEKIIIHSPRYKP